MKRAYSVFTVKSVDEDQRVIEGVATTPTTDRVGDIVEPEGAKFALPLPLLWQHNSREPIGHVTRAAVTKDGITVQARFARIAEPGKLRDRLDEAWQSLKSGLVRGFSIGFMPLEEGMEPINPKEPWGGQRFTAWEWLELSAVTIPANIDASIQTIKSADQQHLSAALRATRVKTVRLEKPAPGATGSTATLKDIAMKTIKEQISAFEAKRAASAAAATEIMDKAGAEGSTLAEDQKQKYDALMLEVKEVDEHLGRLREIEKLNAEKAAAIDTKAGIDPELASKARAAAGSGIRVESKLEPGVRFARMAMAIARAKASGGMGSPEMFYRADPIWMSSAPEVAQVLKAAVSGGDSTTAGWASELAYAENIAREFITFLRPRTIIGRVSGWRNVPFNIRVGSQTGGMTGYWVGQGKGIPMSKGATSSVSLGIAKVAGLTSIDKELARLSTPSAELMVRNDLAAECQKVLDLSLIDPNQGGQTNIQPASLTYGVTPVTPTGTNYAAFVTDVKSLFSTAIAAQLDVSQAVWVTSPTNALALSLMVTSLGNPQFPGLTINGGTLMGLPAITTTQANIAGSPQFANMMVLIFPGEVFLADDGTANVEASDQVSIQMDDATTQSSTATATGTSVVSMFQTESIAIKAVRYINWAKARSQACAFIQAAAYA
jgi:HK97 family phage major capsid protein/HK97 family phage prohead protease